jgi:hypothetical protein
VDRERISWNMEPYPRLSLQAISTLPQGLHYNWALQHHHIGDMPTIVPVFNIGAGGLNIHPYMNSQHIVAQAAAQGSGTFSIPQKVRSALVISS